MAYSQTQFQLTHLMQKAYRRVANVRTSTATGGSTTTIVDEKLLDYLEDSNEDDYLNNWTVFVVTDSAGAGADPEGKFSIISDYTPAHSSRICTASWRYTYWQVEYGPWLGLQSPGHPQSAT